MRFDIFFIMPSDRTTSIEDMNKEVTNIPKKSCSRNAELALNLSNPYQ